MKCLFILWLLFLLRGGKGYDKRYPDTLLTIKDAPMNKTLFVLSWDPLKNWDEKDPIVGYKVAFWETKTGKMIIHRFVDGQLRDEEIEDRSSTTPVGPPKIYTVSANETKVEYNNVKVDVWYEMAILAFTAKGEGPLSPIRQQKVCNLTCGPQYT